MIIFFEGFSVDGFFVIDMTAYTKPGTTEVVGFITDNVDANLTKFTKTLVTAYCPYPLVLEYSPILTLSFLVSIGIAESKCGYGCSDHASWTSAGYSSVFPFESKFGLVAPQST